MVISAFAPVLDVRKTITPQLRLDQGSSELLLIDLGLGKNRLGASCLAQVFNQLGDVSPDIDDPQLMLLALKVNQPHHLRDLQYAVHLISWLHAVEVRWQICLRRGDNHS